ncbi:MAG: hypothetical protein LBM23_07020 [Propionibacteriaceae bacterium]|nr:hypothetical protein [Propionibacteriaceae bacterium]
MSEPYRYEKGPNGEPIPVTAFQEVRMWTQELVSWLGCGSRAADRELGFVQVSSHSRQVVRDQVWLRIIQFDATASDVLPLTEARKLTQARAGWRNDELPFNERGTYSNYGPAFALLRQRIDEDLDRLRRDTWTPNRPAVFFLTDGKPSDDPAWRQEYRALRDLGNAEEPGIVALGFGESVPAVLSSVGTRSHGGRAYQSKSESGLGVVGPLFRYIANSIASSVKAGELCPSDDDADLNAGYSPVRPLTGY